MDSLEVGTAPKFDIDYERVFRAVNAARSFATGEQLELVIAGLYANGIDRYPYFDQLIRRIGGQDIYSPRRNRDLLHMVGAEIFLRVKSAAVFPKYSNRPSYLHPLETREIFSECAEGVVSLNGQIEGAITTTLHDNIEDFECTARELAFFFGPKIANSVDLMTTKNTATLALWYPQITAQHLPVGFTDQMYREEFDVAEYLEDFEKKMPGKYGPLKRALKREFKLGELLKLNFVGVGTKGADGIAVTNRFVRDIEYGDIIIDPHLPLGMKKETVRGRKPVSAELIFVNIEDRTEYHEAVIKQIQGYDEARTYVQTDNYMVFAQRLTDRFAEARASLLGHLNANVTSNDNAELRSRIDVAATWQPPRLAA